MKSAAQAQAAIKAGRCSSLEGPRVLGSSGGGVRLSRKMLDTGNGCLMSGKQAGAKCESRRLCRIALVKNARKAVYQGILPHRHENGDRFMKSKMLRWIFTMTAFMGYCICLGTGITGKISWLQNFNQITRYYGYDWKIIGFLCYMCFLLGVFLINRTWIEKLLELKGGTIWLSIPVIGLFVIEMVRRWGLI